MAKDQALQATGTRQFLQATSVARQGATGGRGTLEVAGQGATGGRGTLEVAVAIQSLRMNSADYPPAAAAPP